MITSTRTVNLKVNKCPSAARIPELASDNGIAPSSTPCGQIYLQKNGSPIPSELVTNAGSSITKLCISDTAKVSALLLITSFPEVYAADPETIQTDRENHR